MIVIRKRRALRRALTELHGFIVTHLDRDPMSIEAYITDPKARAVARPCDAIYRDLEEQYSTKGEPI